MGKVYFVWKHLPSPLSRVLYLGVLLRLLPALVPLRNSRAKFMLRFCAARGLATGRQAVDGSWVNCGVMRF